jgi:hypothetical protein
MKCFHKIVVQDNVVGASDDPVDFSRCYAGVFQGAETGF